MSQPHPVNATANTQELPKILVNGNPIDEKALASELQYHSGVSFDEVVFNAARALVIRELIKQQLEARNIDESVGEELAFAKLIEENIAYTPPSDDECLNYYHSNREKFKTPTKIHVSHILLPAAKDDLEAREKHRQLCDILLADIQRNPNVFADYANRYSACPSKAQGGDLGFITKGQTVAEFERAIFAMKPGIADRPIESRYGIHLVQIHERKEGQALSYELVKDRIRSYLGHLRKNQATQQYLLQLIKDSEIQGIRLLDDDNYLAN